MDNISDILSSLSEEDIGKLKNMASSIFGEQSQPAEASPGIDLSSITNALSKLNFEDDNVRFLRSLKPVLSERRRRKADEAINIIRIMKLMPMLKSSGLLGDLK